MTSKVPSRFFDYKGIWKYENDSSENIIPVFMWYIICT